jgi:F0F1-type ATP synthase assembly protein I
MANKNPAGHEPHHVVVPPKSDASKLDYTYIIGGILLWGLIGWGLDNLLHTGWILFAALPVGAVCGYFLARHHQRHGRRDDTPQQ